MDRCVLMATGGERQSAGALRCAQDLSLRLGLPLEVVSVCEPTAVFGYESAELLAGVRAEMAEAALSIRQNELNELLAEVGIDNRLPLHVGIGAPAETIARVAGERGAALVVVGRGAHSALDRVLGDETELRLMQSSPTPLLSVPEGYGELPARVLAAVDFTSSSLAAAHRAAALLAPGTELHLVHVTTDHAAVDFGTWREPEWRRAVRQEVESRLDLVVDELARARPDIMVRSHVVDGRPVQTLLRLAEDLEVDMLAAGTNGFGILGRLLMGSVATQLVRRAGCMTLIVPPLGRIPSRGEMDANGHRNRVAVGTSG